MTGWSSPEHRARSKEAGFDYHLAKPLDLAALDSLLASQNPAETASSSTSTTAAAAARRA
jgi:hypothetical protein